MKARETTVYENAKQFFGAVKVEMFTVAESKTLKCKLKPNPDH